MEENHEKICSLIVAVLLLLALAGCNGTPTEYTLTLPTGGEDVGFLRNFSGTLSSGDRENEFLVNEGEDIIIFIEILYGYTAKDMVVKDNGKVVELTDESSEYRPMYYSFTISNFDKDHIITVEGVKILSHKLNFHKARYAENEDDKVGTVFEDYDDSFLVIAYGNEYYYSIDDAIEALNAKKIEIVHDKGFELWMGERYKNSYANFIQNVKWLTEGDGTDFVGISGILDDDGKVVVLSPHNGAPFSATYDFDAEGEAYINKTVTLPSTGEEVTLYNFSCTVDGETNFYFDTIRLENYMASYSISSKLTHEPHLFHDTGVYEIEWLYDRTARLTYADEVSFKIIEKKDDGSVIYDNIEVFVNGEQIVEIDGKYSFGGTPPSGYPEGEVNLDQYVLSIKGITFANPEDYFTLEIDSDILGQGGERLGRYDVLVHNEDTDENLVLVPVYYEDNVLWFERLDNMLVRLEMPGDLDLSNLTIYINDEEVTNPVFEPQQYYGYYYYHSFGSDYPDEIVIKLEGLQLLPETD